MRAAILPLAFVTWAAGLAAQDLPQHVEERLQALEKEAARARRLEIRVAELEARLEDSEADRLDEQLEASISALVSRIDDRPAVLARKATALTVGGQLRLRTEYRTVSLYGDPDPRDTDEDFTIQRTRIEFDARLREDLRVFAQIQDSRTWGEEITVLTDLMGVDLHQGYMDFERIFGTGFTLRVGRFELKLWNQRLISPLDWHPVGRAWDGVLVFGSPGDFELAGGYQIVTEDPVVDSDRDLDFYWAAATWRGAERHEIGAAFFWLHDKSLGADIAFGTPTVHAQGSFGAFDYGIDLAANFGEAGSLDIEAYAVAVVLGYTFSCDWSPRLSVEWTWASGDEDPTDGELGTFNPLFPFGHYYQGFLDIFAWRNGHDLALRLDAKPDEAWSFQVAVHGFWLDEEADSWYGAAGTPIRTAPAAGDRFVGVEVDLSAKYRIAKNVLLWFGYSHFFAGDFVEETGRDPDTDWIFVQLTADF